MNILALPTSIDIGPVSITFYALCILTGAVLALLLSMWGIKRKGYNLIGLDVSKIQGKSGNIEYLGHFKANEKAREIDIVEVIDRAFNNEEIEK